MKYKEFFTLFKKFKEDATFEDVRWFFAYNLADQLTDDLTTKDLAQMLNGDYIGIKTKKDVQNAIDDLVEALDDDNALIEDELKLWFQ